MIGRERDGKRAGGRGSGETERELETRQGYGNMSVHQYSDSKTITAHYLAD